MVRSLFRALGVLGECSIHLEYRVPPPQGRGKASHTDLMVVAGETALAVEAKWTEPEYDSVDVWRQGVDAVNGPVVLQGWLGLLQAHATQPLDPTAFGPVTYQMIHRAASACDAGRNPILAYVLFTPSPSPQTATPAAIGAQLALLRALLGRPASFPFFLVEINLALTANFEGLMSQGAGAAEVMAAIEGNEPLFTFGKYSVQAIP